MARKRRSRLMLVLAATLAGLPLAPATAAERTWVNNSGGLITDPANWSARLVPGSADSAAFTLGALTPYTVTLKADLTNNQLIIRNDSVKLSKGVTSPITYTLTSKTLPSVIVGDQAGNSGKLNLDSITLYANWSAIGNNPGSTGEATLTGAGTSWTNTNGLMVGWLGKGTLSILNGASVSSKQGAIGSQAGSEGTLTVDGSGSSWVMSGQLIVGDQGTAQMTVKNKASVRSATAVVGSQDIGSLAVDGGATFDSSDLYVASGSDSVGTFNITNGGIATGLTGSVASGQGATGWVTVDGTASKWNLGGKLTVGNGGAGSLLVRNAAAVSALALDLGSTSTANGSMSVTGAQSQAIIKNDVVIAKAGTGALTISAGALLSNASSTIAANAQSFGSVRVADAGSRWTVADTLIVGDAGTGTLQIEQQGAVTSKLGIIGKSAGGDGAVFVTGAGSSWTIAGHLTIGSAGAGQLEITRGGIVTDQGASIGLSPTGTGAVKVSGSGSVWNTAAVFVGDNSPTAPAAGQLTVSDSATLNATDTITIYPAGKLTLNQGTINAQKVELAGGTLTGTGTLASPLLIDNGQINLTSGKKLVVTAPFSTAPNATLRKTGTGALEIQGPQNHAPGTTLNVAEGSALLISDAGPTAPNLNITVADNAAIRFESTQHLASLRLGAITQLNSTLLSAAFTPGGDKVLWTKDLTIAPQGKFDLADNDLILQAAPDTRDAALARLAGYIKSANLLSSSTAANRYTGLAVILNDNGRGSPITATFANQPVDSNSILVKYTWLGDVNLDGVIDASDYFLVDSGFITQQAQYRNGDLNFDGKIDAADYFLIDSAFIAQTGPLSPHSTPVPEPTTLLPLLASLLPRRRRP